MKQEITFISDQASFIESLSTVIREIVREELVNLTNDEVCSYLHISRSTLYRCVNLGIINCYKMNKRNLFKLKEIEASFTKVSV